MMFNFGKKKKDPAQAQMEAKLQAKSAIRQMEKYAASLGQVADKCKKFIIENEKAGRRSIALQNARMYRTITQMQNKVECLITRVRMLMEMGELSNVMNDFIEKCNGMSGILGGLMDPSKMLQGQASFATALAQLDDLLYRSEAFLPDIDVDETESGYTDPEDVKALESILAENSKKEEAAKRTSELDALNRALDERAKKSVKN